MIQLSLLQLFDLATALDEYSADIMALPNLETTRSSIVNFPAWAPVAAVLVLGVGLLPITWQYVNQTKSSQQQVATKPTTESDPSALLPSPLPSTQADLIPPDSLPPVPPVGSVQPPVISTVPIAPITAPNSNLTNNLPTSSNPGLSTSQTSAGSNLRSGNLPVSGNANPTFPNIPQLDAPATSGKPQIAIKPNPTTNIPGSISQAEIALPNKRELPPSLSANRGAVSPNIPTTAPPLPTIPNQTASKLEGEYNPASTASSAKVNDNLLVERLRNGRTPSTSTQVATDSTLFDTPQVAEARQYLQKRWQPPAGLKQTLEYSLIVGVDGTVEPRIQFDSRCGRYRGTDFASKQGSQRFC